MTGKVIPPTYHVKIAIDYDSRVTEHQLVKLNSYHKKASIAI
jgi:hypothetical protein